MADRKRQQGAPGSRLERIHPAGAAWRRRHGAYVLAVSALWWNVAAAAAGEAAAPAPGQAAAAGPAEDGAPAPAGVEPAVLEEVVVTATKRKEELSKVPISIVAYNRDALEASGVKSFGDLAALTPGVEFDTSAGFGPGTLTNVAIRGINSTIGTSTTGIYLDDTPIQTRVTALSYFGNPLPLMFDVDRVEVDRGPQGTLFGAGAEGGALRFINPEPGLSKTSGFVRSEVAFTDGGGPSYEAGAAVGGPLVATPMPDRASWPPRCTP
jgi:outer membrane receptor protein involved in Fe transport